MKSYPARLFKIKKEKWEKAGGEELMLEDVGVLDGKKFIVLTYENAYEFDVDLSASGLKSSEKLASGKDYTVIELRPLPQQESISYIEEGRGFIYDSEYHRFDVPIMKVECLDGKRQPGS